MDLTTYYGLEAKVLDLRNKVDATKDTLQDITNESYHILKASNKNLKAFISRLEGTGIEKAMIIEDGGGFCGETEGPWKRTRASKKKKASKNNNETTMIKEASRKMDILEKEAANILMNMD